MTDDETQIRTLIERWAAAVHAGDLHGVLADHSTDIVMFDVPPPYDGVRGIDAYRATWPPFFEWQRHGAVFDIVTLDVTPATTSRSRTRSFVAAPRQSSNAIRTTAFASPSVCARRTAAGSCRTSITRSHRPELESRSRMSLRWLSQDSDDERVEVSADEHLALVGRGVELVEPRLGEVMGEHDALDPGAVRHLDALLR